MAFLMFALFAIFILIAYFCGKRNFLSPWFLLCAIFLVTYCIVLLNFRNWDVKINSRFVLYVSTAILAFGCGTLLVNTLCPVTEKNSKALRLSEIEYNKKYPVNLLLIVSAAFSLLYIFKLLSGASGGSISEKLRDIYERIVNDNYSPGFIFNQFNEVVRAIAYVNTYRLFLKTFSKKDKISFVKLIIPIFLFLLTALIATDRNVFLRYGIYFVFLWMLFYYNNCKKNNVNLRIVCIALIMVIIILLLFFFMGKMKQYKSNFLRSLSIYGGSGLYNFNLWLNDFNEPLMNGAATFATFLNTIRAILGRLGINIDVQSLNRFDVFIHYESSNGYVYSSNIYSALKPFTADFGYFGVILFPFIIGAFYQWLYTKAKNCKYRFSWVVYCMLIYPVLFFPILEQLFGRFTLGFVYELFWLVVIYYLTIGRKSKVVVKRNIPKIKGVQNAKG